MIYGTVFILKLNNFIKYKYIKKIEIDNELKKTLLGIKNTIKELKIINKKINKYLKNKNKFNIFNIQIKILCKKNFIKNIIFFIKKKKFNSYYSIYYSIYLSQIDILKNKYNFFLKNEDIITDIINRLNKNIYKNSFNKIYNITSLEKNKILIFKNLININILYNLNFKNVNLIIINKYKNNSINKIKNIPILYLNNIIFFIKNGDYIFINKLNNNIYINPDSKKIKCLI
ncbi:phosphoenolpyruvate-protein phosphotransferase [endosymbiont of Sipalinus gigas]|uniref:hypothetical protein n=1 Tax=endosymbiont of Sipalinus gigas TaxID=1972134 RepID=UPI000DC71BB0|nr:hypothetical protein [endosymbiont of Sipalinus gigas]BBA85354.1 phosphoenolpyruvate-protein phosphotransferase [endosymbiont of Sipalinus gigas]